MGVALSYEGGFFIPIPGASQSTADTINRSNSYGALLGGAATVLLLPGAAISFSIFSAGIDDGPPLLGPLGNATKAAASASAEAGILPLLRARALQLAGFSGKGPALILDENLSGRGVAEALRARGFNIRSVKEIFGSGTIKDPRIRQFAEATGARTVTADRGSDLLLGGGLGKSEIRIPGKANQNVDAIARRIAEELGR